MRSRRARHVWRDPAGDEPAGPRQPTRQYSAPRHSRLAACNTIGLACYGPSQVVLVNSGDDSQAFANPRQPKYGEPVARYSAIRGRNLTTYEAAIERFASSRVGAWLFLHVINPIDRRVLPLSRGRLSLAVGAPVGLLQSVGARTGQVRRTPLLYLRDAGGIVVVASNGGSRRHPAWLHNIKANPDIWFLSAEDGWRPYHARIEAGDARAERWARALDLYAGYRRYQQRTPRRQIPVVVLDRTSDEDMHPGSS